MKDLASGAPAEGTALQAEALKSGRTDHVPVASTNPEPQPERSSEPHGPPVLSSKVPLSDFGEEDAIILITGPAGSGKSSFISKVTGKVDEGVGHDLSAGPYTKEVRATKCVVDGIPTILVDVPGFDGATPAVMISILCMISNWLSNSNKSKALISAVLLFHSIVDNRMRWVPREFFDRCREWFGDELAPQVKIDLVTTMWDVVDKAGNERFVELEGNYWKPMLDDGSTIFRYWNTSESAMELLRAVVCKKSKQIQPAGVEVASIARARQPPGTGDDIRCEVPHTLPNWITDPSPSRCHAPREAIGTSGAFLLSEPGGIRDHSELAMPQALVAASAQPKVDPNGTAIQPPQEAVHEAHEVQLNELSSQDILILIIGPVGCGKSSFIGKAIGSEEGIGHTLCAGSHTREIRATRCTIGNFTNAVLLDTPGFDNMSTSEKRILDMVYRSLTEVHKDRIFLSAILLFHPITDNRLRWTPLRHLQLFQKLCGKEAMAQTGLVTTMWDEVDEDVGNERVAALRSHYWKAMIAQGSRTYRFWNTRDAARGLLQEVIIRSQEQYHSMLRQKILELKTYKGTIAAQKLCSRLEQLSERRLEITRELHSEEDGAASQRSKEALVKEYAEVGAELDTTLNQAQVLKHSPTLPPLRRLLKPKVSNLKYT